MHVAFAEIDLQSFTSVVRRGDAKALQEILKRLPGIENASDHWMHLAGYSGCAEVIRLLLDRGLSLNARGSTGGTPLYEVASCGASWAFERARVLLQLGADPNVRELGPAGDTVLHRVAQRQQASEMILDLVHHGADVNALAGCFARPPLFDAIEKGHAENVRALIEAGADTKLHVNGLDAYEFAQSKNRHDIAHRMNAWRAQRVIVEAAGNLHSDPRPLSR